MITSSHRARRLLGGALLTVVCASSLGAASPAQAEVVADPGSLVVYDNNLENQTEPVCGYDWKKLYAYIKAQPKSPDIFIVQQISTQVALTALTQRMSAELPGDYAGVIAIARPKSLKDYTDRCEKPPKEPEFAYKAQQTNAVIFRTDRFTKASEIRWRSDAPDNQDVDDPCKNLDEDNGTAKRDGGNQDRVENVAVRLHDRLADKDLTVASFHWPTEHPWFGPYCAGENMREAEARTAEIGSGTLTILGGDANAYVDQKHSGRWWQNAGADHFVDAVGHDCAARCPSSANTSGQRDHRIDFLLVKGGQVADATTIAETATGGKYSDHLALRAVVRY